MSAGVSYNVSPNANDGINGIVPVGCVMMWSATEPPPPWLVCDGSAVSRNVFADLFAVIGTTFGVGDGTTTFNLPNCAGRGVRGVNSTYTLGLTGGADGVDLVDTNLPYHAHVLTDAGHSHLLTNVAEKNQFNNGTAGVNRLAEISTSVAQTEPALSAISMLPSLVGGNGNVISPNQRTLVNIVNPFVAMNYIIKAM